MFCQIFKSLLVINSFVAVCLLLSKNTENNVKLESHFVHVYTYLADSDSNIHQRRSVALSHPPHEDVRAAFLGLAEINLTPGPKEI